MIVMTILVHGPAARVIVPAAAPPAVADGVHPVPATVNFVPPAMGVAVVFPNPPLATGKVPVTPLDSGRPVALVNTAALGVPSAGVVSVGELAKTTLPVPVAPVAVTPPIEMLVPKV